MRIVDRRVFRGPNVYARFQVVRLHLDLEALEERPTSKIPDFVPRLLAAVPSLSEHKCSYGEPGGFVRRMQEGTWLGHVLEHVAIALQNVVGQKVTFGRTRMTGEPGHYHVVFACRDPEIGLAAGDTAFEIVSILADAGLGRGTTSSGDEDHDAAIQRVLGRFFDQARARALGPSTAALAKAATDRGIAWRRIGDGSLLELGYGRHVARVWGTVTSRTSTIAVDIAADKARTRELLADVGLPVVDQRVVTSIDEAIEAARAIGLPVVIKPRRGNHGRAVAFIEHEDEIGPAFTHARAVSSDVLVEAFFAGADHRLLVVDGRMIAAAHRVPAHVVGDGVHTIAQLVERTNADPRRGEGHEAVLTRLPLDADVEHLLARRGTTPDDVPAPGRVVMLCRTANLSTGGTAIDVTDTVHPDNRRAAERAARVIGLDVAGIDFLVPDITRSFLEVGGAICEVNASPGLRMHLAPSVGRPRDVAGPIIDSIFPPGQPHSIPIAAITGTNGKTTTCRMLARICAQVYSRVGLCTTDGVYIADDVDFSLVWAGDMSGPMGTHTVVTDPGIDLAVLEVARGGILRAGMGVPSVDVAAVTNVQTDHIGLLGVEDLDALAHVKRVVVEVARDTAVLNADDPRVRAMAPHCRAREICFVSTDSDDPFVRERIDAGHPVVTIDMLGDGPFIVAHRNHVTTPIIAAAEIPATLDGIAEHNVINAAFATAMALAMRIPPMAIRRGLEGFHADFETTPGRLNVYDGLPFRVVLDYAHNPAGFRQIIGTLAKMRVAGRRIGVVGMAGDRRDEDFAEGARELAGFFDLLVCRGESDPRGRAPGEPPRVMAAALVAAGADPDAVFIDTDELDGVRTALDRAEPGDLVVIFGVHLREIWDLVRTYAPARSRKTPAAG